jgi:hypothetical protein
MRKLNLGYFSLNACCLIKQCFSGNRRNHKHLFDAFVTHRTDRLMSDQFKWYVCEKPFLRHYHMDKSKT